MSHLKPVAGISPGGHASLAAREPGVLGDSIRQVEQFGLARLQGQKKDGWTSTTVKHMNQPIALKYVFLFNHMNMLMYLFLFYKNASGLLNDGNTRKACVCSIKQDGGSEKVFSVLLSRLLPIFKPEFRTTSTAIVGLNQTRGIITPILTWWFEFILRTHLQFHITFLKMRSCVGSVHTMTMKPTNWPSWFGNHSLA